MNEQSAFERIVADSVSSIGPLAPSAGAVDRTVARVSRTRQRPRWLALIKAPPMRRSSRLAVGSPMARVMATVAATILLALTLAGAGIAASRLLADERATFGNGPIIVNGTAYDPYTGEIVPDPCDGCTTDASWSADGQRVAFREVSQIYVVDLSDGRRRLLAHCADCDYQPQDSISMAADGGGVAFIDEGDVWLVDIDTGARTRVTDLGEGRQARTPTLAPEGDRVAFAIDGEPGIWVSELDGGQPWLLTDEGPTDPELGNGPYDPAWSPDGRTIAYLRDQFSPREGSGLQLWLVDVVTGKERRIANWPGCCVTGQGGPAWSPDSRELAIVATGERTIPTRSPGWALWVVAADGSSKRAVSSPGLGQPAWRPVPLAEVATPPADPVVEDPPMPT